MGIFHKYWGFLFYIYWPIYLYLFCHSLSSNIPPTLKVCLPTISSWTWLETAASRSTPSSLSREAPMLRAPALLLTTIRCSSNIRTTRTLAAAAAAVGPAAVVVVVEVLAVVMVVVVVVEADPGTARSLRANSKLSRRAPLPSPEAPWAPGVVRQWCQQGLASTPATRLVTPAAIQVHPRWSSLQVHVRTMTPMWSSAGTSRRPSHDQVIYVVQCDFPPPFSFSGYPDWVVFNLDALSPFDPWPMTPWPVTLSDPKHKKPAEAKYLGLACMYAFSLIYHHCCFYHSFTSLWLRFST